MITAPGCENKCCVSFVIRMIDVGTCVQQQAKRVTRKIYRRVGQRSRVILSSNNRHISLGFQKLLEDSFFTLACRSDDGMSELASSKVRVSAMLEENIDNISSARLNSRLQSGALGHIDIGRGCVDVSPTLQEKVDNTDMTLVRSSLESPSISGVDVGTRVEKQLDYLDG